MVRAALHSVAGYGATRRQFLGRCGVLGAGLVLARVPAAIAAPPPGTEVMHLLARDTIRGLAVFAVPGPDRYSAVQGETSPTPGAIEAKADELLLPALDRFLPFPDSYVQALAAAFTTGVSDTPLPAGLLEQGVASLDQALRQVLANDEHVPLSLLVALILNFEASAVDPRSMAGPFPASPFANLRVASKARVFEQLEQDQSDLVALLDEHAPQPLKGEISGLMKYVGGTLLEFATFAPYSEHAVFDPERRVATERPVGWDLTNYMPGRTTPADGWPEHKGYYEGRRAVTGHPRYA